MLKRKSSKSSGTGESDHGSVTSSSAEFGGEPSSVLGQQQQQQQQQQKQQRRRIKAKSILGFLDKKRRKKKALKKKKSQKLAALAAVDEKENSSPPSSAESTTRPPSSIEPDFDDEDDTEYGVSIDNHSISNISTVNVMLTQESVDRLDSFGSIEDANGGSISKPMEIILLLMDSNSRRFELLQLEFDALKAIVRDVITQISFSATEEALREQKYSYVCFPSGTMIEADDEMLSKYCKGGEVLIAVPEGMDGDSCEKLSKPILNDPNIVRLLGNVNNSPTNDKEFREKEETTERGKNESSDSDQIAGVIPVYTDQSSKNILAAQRSSPETILEEEHNQQSTTDSSTSDTGASSSIKLLLVFIAIMLPLIWKYQQLVTAPLSPGQVISPGERRSKCGLLSMLPKPYCDCNISYIEMDRSGVLKIINHENIETVTLTGATCDSEKSMKANELCVQGAVVKENGRLLIGGASPTMSGDKSLSLTPWPFIQRITNNRGKY